MLHKASFGFARPVTKLMVSPTALCSQRPLNVAQYQLPWGCGGRCSHPSGTMCFHNQGNHPESNPKLLHLRGDGQQDQGPVHSWQDSKAAAARKGKQRRPSPKPQKSALKRAGCPRAPTHWAGTLPGAANPANSLWGWAPHNRGGWRQAGPFLENKSRSYWGLRLSPSVSVLKSMERACSSAWGGRLQSARVKM